MATQQRAAPAWVTLAVAALLYSMAWAQQGPSVPMKYCSDVNTADLVGPCKWLPCPCPGPDANSYTVNYNWQSDGRCYGNCTDSENAFAIVQNKNCWCSNLIPHPNDRKPIEDCRAPCPGYPTDHCGGDGTFGYMEVGGFNPSGTASPVAKEKPSPTVSITFPNPPTDMHARQNWNRPPLPIDSASPFPSPWP
jgi:cell wall integrity and stress response component